MVCGSLEHEVLKQVGKARPPRLLVLGADVIPQVDRNDWTGTVGMHNDIETVVERLFLVGDPHARTVIVVPWCTTRDLGQ